MADLHLGFTGAGRVTNGRNVREMDVEAAWIRAVDNAIEAQPDLITIAGDCFHNPRVSMHAVTAFRDGIRRLVGFTTAHIIILQGNHDAARTASSKSPIWIPSDYERVHVVLEPTRIPLVVDRTGERLSVACFPYVALGTQVAYKVEPDPDADVNVLLVHAAVKGSDGDLLPYFYGGAGALDIGREADRWDVVAVGDFHEFRILHPTRLAFYSGSIERTSSDIWKEKAEKGVVVYDTANGDMRLLTHATRPVIDRALNDFDEDHGAYTIAYDSNAVGVNNCLARLLTANPDEFDESVEDAIVRLVVPDFPRAEKESIDWNLVRELKQRALHFQLDLRFAKRAEDEVRDRRTGGARTLADEAAAFFADQRPEVRDLALRYLGIDQVAEVVEPELAEVAA